MAFSRENEEWVRGEINKAIKDVIEPPSGAREFLQTLKSWGLIATLFSVPLALLALFVTASIFALTQWNAANNRLVLEANFRTNTENRLTEIEKSLLRFQISKAATTPTQSASQMEAVDALASAKKSNIRIPISVVREAGASFLTAAKVSPPAWKVGLDYVSYRSSLNSFQQPLTFYSGVYPQANRPISYPFDYHILSVLGKASPEIRTAAPLVPPPQATICDFIGHNANNPHINQPSSLLFKGGAISLDGVQIRHVLFSGVEIHYSGHPLIMEDATFVNCTFVFEYSDHTRELGQQILASMQAVDFKASA